jgi:LAGLIDADG endonuclease
MSAEITEVEKAYLAGLVDGEGCIAINRSADSRYVEGFAYYPRVTVAMCDREPLEYYKVLTGFGALNSKPSYKKGWTPIHQWTVSTRQAEKLLKMIYPYLKIKREQAQIFLLFYSLLNSKRTHITDEQRGMKVIYYLALQAAKKVHR